MSRNERRFSQGKKDRESEFKSPFSNCPLFVAKLLPFRVIKDSGDRIVLDHSAVDRSAA